MAKNAKMKGFQLGRAVKAFRVSIFAAAVSAATSTSVFAVPQQINADTAIDAEGQAEGVVFSGDHMLSIGEAQDIGVTSGVSVNPNGTVQGTLNFLGSSTISDIVGNYGGSYGSYDASATGVNTIDLSSSSGVVAFRKSVIFNSMFLGSSSTAHFRSDNGSHVAIQGDITPVSNNQGIIKFSATNGLAMYGDVGTSSLKVGSINIASSLLWFWMSGNIFANSVLLDNSSGESYLVLNNKLNSFESFALDSPVTTNQVSSGVLMIRGPDVNILGQIGSPTMPIKQVTSELGGILELNQDVYADQVQLLSGGNLVASNDVYISGILDLIMSSSGGFLLDVGLNTLTVGGEVQFRQNTTEAFEKKLAVSISGNNSGQVDASAGGFGITGASIVEVDVIASPASDGTQYIIVRSNAPITIPGTLIDNSATWDFSLSQSGNDLLLTALQIRSEPVVNAGSDQIVAANTTVSLSGMASDSDGSITTYLWQQIGGSSVNLLATDAVDSSFTAPDVSSVETLTFSFTATDNDGDSTTDSVSITVNPVGKSPDGSGSFNLLLMMLLLTLLLIIRRPEKTDP
ncbi:MAG: hypothetical protein GY938_27630 [Ketobacter sp.]|nr:hypothetical protein [Ketobacter sp.]